MSKLQKQGRVSNVMGIDVERYGVDLDRQVLVRVTTCEASDAVCVDRVYDIMYTDTKLKEYYNDALELPKPILSAVCVLRMVGVNEIVKGVGWRPSEHVYWVMVDRDEITK